MQFFSETDWQYITPEEVRAELTMLLQFHTHPRIVRLLGVVLWADGRVKYIVTERARGSLTDILRQYRAEGEPIQCHACTLSRPCLFSCFLRFTACLDVCIAHYHYFFTGTPTYALTRLLLQAKHFLLPTCSRCCVTCCRAWWPCTPARPRSFTAT